MTTPTPVIKPAFKSKNKNDTADKSKKTPRELREISDLVDKEVDNWVEGETPLPHGLTFSINPQTKKVKFIVNTTQTLPLDWEKKYKIPKGYVIKDRKFVLAPADTHDPNANLRSSDPEVVRSTVPAVGSDVADDDAEKGTAGDEAETAEQEKDKPVRKEKDKKPEKSAPKKKEKPKAKGKEEKDEEQKEQENKTQKGKKSESKKEKKTQGEKRKTKASKDDASDDDGEEEGKEEGGSDNETDKEKGKKEAESDDDSAPKSKKTSKRAKVPTTNGTTKKDEGKKEENKPRGRLRKAGDTGKDGCMIHVETKPKEPGDDKVPEPAKSKPDQEPAEKKIKVTQPASTARKIVGDLSKQEYWDLLRKSLILREEMLGVEEKSAASLAEEYGVRADAEEKLAAQLETLAKAHKALATNLRQLAASGKSAAEKANQSIKLHISKCKSEFDSLKSQSEQAEKDADLGEIKAAQAALESAKSADE